MVLNFVPGTGKTKQLLYNGVLYYNISKSKTYRSTTRNCGAGVKIDDWRRMWASDPKKRTRFQTRQHDKDLAKDSLLNNEIKQRFVLM